MQWVASVVHWNKLHRFQITANKQLIFPEFMEARSFRSKALNVVTTTIDV